MSLMDGQMSGLVSAISTDPVILQQLLQKMPVDCYDDDDEQGKGVSAAQIESRRYLSERDCRLLAEKLAEDTSCLWFLGNTISSGFALESSYRKSMLDYPADKVAISEVEAVRMLSKLVASASAEADRAGDMSWKRVQDVARQYKKSLEDVLVAFTAWGMVADDTGFSTANSYNVDRAFRKLTAYAKLVNQHCKYFLPQQASSGLTVQHRCARAGAFASPRACKDGSIAFFINDAWDLSISPLDCLCLLHFVMFDVQAQTAGITWFVDHANGPRTVEQAVLWIGKPQSSSVLSERAMEQEIHDGWDVVDEFMCAALPIKLQREVWHGAPPWMMAFGRLWRLFFPDEKGVAHSVYTDNLSAALSKWFGPPEHVPEFITSGEGSCLDVDRYTGFSHRSMCELRCDDQP